MTTRLIAVIVAFVILVALIAFAFPTLITAADSDIEATLQLDDGETGEIRETLNATVHDVTAANATIELERQDTGETDNRTVDLDQTVEYVLGDETVYVTVTSISNGNTIVTADYTYSSTFGWSDEAVLIADNLDLLLAVLVLILVTGMVMAVVRG